jgi:hypothetical protein
MIPPLAWNPRVPYFIPLRIPCFFPLLNEALEAVPKLQLLELLP